MRKMMMRRRKNVPVAVGAEENGVIKSLACKSACAIIKSITVSSWTSFFEYGGILGRLACRRVSKLSAAAVLVQTKCLAGALASDHAPFASSSHHLKLFRATCMRVSLPLGLQNLNHLGPEKLQKLDQDHNLPVLISEAQPVALHAPNTPRGAAMRGRL